MIKHCSSLRRQWLVLLLEYPELSGKRLELLRELVPQLRRVLVLYDPGDASPRQSVAAQFVINLRTAKAIGLAVPRSVLLRADQVIE